MNFRAVQAFGIALPLAAAIIVALVAVVFSLAPGDVGAHECEDGELPTGTTATSTPVPDVHCEAERHDSSTTHAAVSSTEPNSEVAIRLNANAGSTINEGETITVEFTGPSADSGFILPLSITTPTSPTAIDSRVMINGNIFPTQIDVDGRSVILTVPSGGVISGPYTITFKLAAGIESPYYAGIHTITVDDGDAEDDVNTVVIERITTIDPEEGPRGAEFEIEGRGYPAGTVTIFDKHPNSDGAEILATTDTGTRTSGTFNLKGTFSVDLPVRGDSRSLSYAVWIKDSEGEVVQAPSFHVSEHRTSFEPPTAVVGLPLRISIADWQYGEAKGIAAVRIAGENAYVTGAIQRSNCIDYTGRSIANDEHLVSLVVTVPEGILEGTQTVSLYDYDQLEVGGNEAPTPCGEGPVGEQQSGTEVDVRLPDNAIPLLQETVPVSLSEPRVEARGLNSFDVNGGRDERLEFKVFLTPDERNSYLDEGDEIEINLPDFNLSDVEFDADLEDGGISISGSDHTITNADAGLDPGLVKVAGDKITLTIPGSPATTHGASEDLVFTITKGTGILTPQVPQGFEDPGDGYPVTITFVDNGPGQPKSNLVKANRNKVVVNNPISSTVPSATVRVELVAFADVEIGSGEEITVDFSGPSADSEFSVPSNITNTRVTIDPDTGSSFNPSDILVQGARVILTIPSGESPKRITEGEYKITFSNLARIRNPSAAGNRVIEVSSSAQGDLPDRITAVILRTTTIDTLEGPRGTEFTLEGKGYSRGTVTIYNDANDNRRIDAGEFLDSVNTVRGAFDVDLVARGEPGDLMYLVRTKDSEGVDDEVVFIIRSGMFFQPSTARVGSPLKITIADWLDPDREVAAVSIAGETAHVPEVTEYANCFDYTDVFSADGERLVSLEVEVPRHVPGGNQTVAVYDHLQLDHLDEDGNVLPDKPACASGQTRGSSLPRNVTASLKSEPIAIIKNTIEIDTQDVVLTPATAVRGQRVTITGSGFTRASRGSNHIDSVWIGGIRVRDDHSGFEVGSNGNIAFSVTVPLGVAGGRNEVRLEGADRTLGQATLTVPEAAITLVPEEGQRGTELTVIGTGFIAKEPVILTYHSDAVVTNRTVQLAGSGLLADSQGGFELTIDVPITAEVGKDHLVTAMAEVDARGETASVEAEARHYVTQADISTAPETVSPGDHLTIIGENLPLFTLVGSIRIAGIDVTPATEVATDEEGSFETRVLVPHIEFGDQTLLVQVAGVVIPLIIELAPPPLSGSPSQVFKQPIQVGALQAVWHYDNATQAWSLFDPNLPEDVSDLNDLDQVTSGDIVWIRLSTSLYFQGGLLTEGWNLIALK